MTNAPATATPNSQAAPAPAAAPADLAEAFDSTSDLGAATEVDDIDTDDLNFFETMTNGGVSKPAETPASGTEEPALPGASGAQPGAKASGGAETPPAAAPTPGETPAAPAAQEPAPPATPAAAAAPAEQGTPPAAASAPAEDLAPEKVAERYKTWRNDRVKSLAETSFILTPEQVELVQTEPEKVIPHLMAQAAVTAMEASTQAIAQMLPGLIEKISNSTKKLSQAEETFFGMWPSLNKPEYRPKLTEIGRLYRSMNPTASTEEFAKMVGAMASAQLNVAGQPVGQQPQGQVPPAALPGVRPVSPLAGGAPRNVGSQPGPAQGTFEHAATTGGLFDPDDEE